MVGYHKSSAPLCLCPNLLEINVDLTPIVLAKKNTCSEVFDLIEDVGRRDWTRTNDPHHVKVVNRTLLNFSES